MRHWPSGSLGPSRFSVWEPSLSHFSADRPLYCLPLEQRTWNAGHQDLPLGGSAEPGHPISRAVVSAACRSDKHLGRQCPSRDGFRSELAALISPRAFAPASYHISMKALPLFKNMLPARPFSCFIHSFHSRYGPGSLNSCAPSCGRQRLEPWHALPPSSSYPRSRAPAIA